MTKGHWIVTFAFGLTLAISAQAQDQTGPANDTARHQQNLPEHEPSGIPVRIIEDSKSREARERSERESEKREKEDLIAQKGMNAATQSMNEATQSMKWAAWLSTIFVAIGTALLVWTLRLTRQANDAAMRAVDVTESIGKIQARAYLTYVTTTVAGAAVDRSRIDVRSGFTFNIMFKNIGNTPASKTQVTSNRRIVPTGNLPPPITIGSDPHPHQFEGSLVGPGNHVAGNPQMFTIQELESSIDSDHILTVSARVDYVDIFGTKRFAESCIMIQVVCDPAYLKQAEITVDRAFQFSMYGPNNTGD